MHRLFFSIGLYLSLPLSVEANQLLLFDRGLIFSHRHQVFYLFVCLFKDILSSKTCLYGRCFCLVSRLMTRSLIECILFPPLSPLLISSCHSFLSRSHLLLVFGFSPSLSVFPFTLSSALYPPPPLSSFSQWLR